MDATNTARCNLLRFLAASPLVSLALRVLREQ
jgi:hypothetical protein